VCVCRVVERTANLREVTKGEWHKNYEKLGVVMRTVENAKYWESNAAETGLKQNSVSTQTVNFLQTI